MMYNLIMVCMVEIVEQVLPFQVVVKSPGIFDYTFLLLIGLPDLTVNLLTNNKSNFILQDKNILQFPIPCF